MKIKFFQIFFTFFVILLVSSLSQAEMSSSPRCYQIIKSDTPERAVNSIGRTEVWCYQKLMVPLDAMFIFNADGAEVRPETAMLVSPDGVITHGSMAAGEVTIHRLRAFKGYNPLSVSLKEPETLPIANGNETAAKFSSAKKVLKQLLETSSHPIAEMALSEGRASVAVPNERLPWRGCWWAYAKKPLYGSSKSPLAKYDRFVQAKTGVNPGSVKWEADHHFYKGIKWEGHCNGWTASAILRKEPSVNRRDPVSGLSFSVADQKGILAERDYCASTAFFGHRYRGKSGDDIYDIYAPLFHNTITYYIGQLGKPVVIEYNSGIQVDNHIVTGYMMNTVKTAANTYTVTMTLRIQKYDDRASDTPGLAPGYIRTYKYELYDDGAGNILSGYWLSENPDFLWVPLSSPKCRSQNPQIEENWTQQILNL